MCINASVIGGKGKSMPRKNIHIDYLPKVTEADRKYNAKRLKVKEQREMQTMHSVICDVLNDLFAIRAIIDAFVELHLKNDGEDYSEDIADTIAYVDTLTNKFKKIRSVFESSDPVADSTYSKAWGELETIFRSSEFKDNFREILCQLDLAINYEFDDDQVAIVTAVNPDTGNPVTVFDCTETTVRKVTENLFRLRYMLASPAQGNIVWEPENVAKEYKELSEFRGQMEDTCVRLMHLAPERRLMTAAQYDKFMDAAPLALHALNILIETALQCEGEQNQSRWEEFCQSPEGISAKELIIAAEYFCPHSWHWIINDEDWGIGEWQSLSDAVAALD